MQQRHKSKRRLAITPAPSVISATPKSDRNAMKHEDGLFRVVVHDAVNGLVFRENEHQR